VQYQPDITTPRRTKDGFRNPAIVLRDDQRCIVFTPGGCIVAVRKIRVCPKCGSDKISDAKSSVSGWLVPTTYYCAEEECDYSGPIYVEIDVEEAEHLKRVMNGDSAESA
jgi:hypothetical protein